MKRRTALVLSAVAGVVLGTVSNWLYDLLRARGLFPTTPTWKAIIIVAIAVLPLIVLVVWPEWTERRRAGKEGRPGAATGSQAEALAQLDQIRNYIVGMDWPSRA